MEALSAEIAVEKKKWYGHGLCVVCVRQINICVSLCRYILSTDLRGLKIWRIFILFLVIYNAAFIPFNLAFGDTSPEVLDIIIDVIFFGDLLLRSVSPLFLSTTNYGVVSLYHTKMNMAMKCLIKKRSACTT